MPEVLSGYDLYKGKKFKDTSSPYTASYFQPLQMLPTKDKTIDWIAQMSWYIEWRGLQQLQNNAMWMIKNYKLAIGEIEKTDYIKQDKDYADMITALEDHAGTVLESMEIKNFPFVSTVVNILTDEFAKRVSHMSFDDKSDIGTNEMLEAKKADIEKYLIMQATIKQQAKMMELGLTPDTEEGQQYMQQNDVKSLPEIQKFYSKSYRNIYQEWAEHQMQVDNDRFSMAELERQNFRNMLITDREFWHFKMMDNDYRVETWNPPQVAYRKSPSVRYISDAAWVVNIDYLTIPDVIDREGWKMSEEQLLSLNQVYGAMNARYGLDGKEPDQYWDGTKDYNWNRTGPSIGMRQAMSVLDNVGTYGGDISRAIINQSEDTYNANGEYLLRVSTIYWKTQRKFYHLTKIDDLGNQVQMIVGEDYKITTKPMYNTVLFPEKTKENLIYGEHLDALWANETWGCVRIGTNLPPAGWQGGSAVNFAPIYLGIKGSTPGRLPFQFKGDNNIYECKLPVEGRVYNDFNTKSRSLVDNLKMWQIGVNVTGNLIQDTMINDYGVIAQIDPNALVKHSLNEDYGQDPLSSAITMMKTGGILPAFGHGRNADGQMIGNNPIQRVDLSQTERLMGLMKIFDWFKMSGLDSVGMNPRRTGTPIGQEATATEVKQDIASSFSHTEYLFSQHCDELMPRVHQMRTDLAQYYNSTNPSVRLQYMASNDEKAFFEIDGTQLMGRDFNVKAKTSVNSRMIMQKVEQLLLTDNTSGADVYDKIKALQVPTLSTLNTLVVEMQKKQEAELGREHQAQMEQLQADQQHQQQLEQQRQAFDAAEAEKDRQKDIHVAEIRAAVAMGTVDLNANQQSDYLDGLKVINGQQQHDDKMLLEQQKMDSDVALKKQHLDLQREKVQAENMRTTSELQQTRIANKVKEKEKKDKQKSK